MEVYYSQVLEEVHNTSGGTTQGRGWGSIKTQRVSGAGLEHMTVLGPCIECFGISSQGQIHQFKPSRVEVWRASRSFIQEKGLGRWGEKAYHQGIWGKSIPGIDIYLWLCGYYLGQVLEGGASVSSRPMQAARSHKIVPEAAILWSSLAKFSIDVLYWNPSCYYLTTSKVIYSV